MYKVLLFKSRRHLCRGSIVDKSPYHAARVNVLRNVFFSSRSEKKIDVDIVVKNKSKCVLSWSVFLSTTSTRHCSFAKQFFVIVCAS